jgi:hypothetical protein
LQESEKESEVGKVWQGTHQHQWAKRHGSKLHTLVSKVVAMHHNSYQRRSPVVKLDVHEELLHSLV